MYSVFWRQFRPGNIELKVLVRGPDRHLAGLVSSMDD